MNTKYVDGYYGSPVLQNRTPKQYPFFKYGDTRHATFTETYLQDEAAYTQAAPGVESSREPGFYLVDNSPPERTGRDKVLFSQTFANIPEGKVVFSSIQFTRPELPQFTSTWQSYGSEADGNAGFIYRSGNTATTAELYTRRAVLTDTGVDTDPTGGTYQIKIGTLATTAAIPYNANSATVKAAMDAATGLLAFNQAAITSPCVGQVKSWFNRPQLIVVSGAGLVSYGTRIAIPALAFPDIKVVDFALTSTEPEYQDGAFDIVNEREPEVFTVSGAGFVILPPIWSFRVPTNTSRAYRGGVVTGGTITLSVNGIALSPITFTPNDLVGFIDGVNAAISDEFGVVYEFFKAPRYILDQYEAYITNDQLEDGESWYSTREYSLKEFRQTLCTFAKGGAPILQPLPATYSYKLSYAYLGGAYAGDEATFTQDSTEADVLAAFNAFDYVTDLGVTFTKIASFTDDSISVWDEYDGAAMAERFAISILSSVTPAPSKAVRWPAKTPPYGDEFRIAASYSPRVITTALPHGLTNGDKLVVRRGTYYSAAIAEFEVLSPTQIQVSPTIDPWANNALVTEIGRYLSTYQSGTGTYRAKDVTTYWLPGASADFDSPDDIPLEQSSITDEQFIDYHFRDRNTSNYMLIESGGIEYYLGAMISQKKRYIDLR